MGEIVLESLLSSNIDTITNLDFDGNSSWLVNRQTKELRTSNFELLLDLINKQTALQTLYLRGNDFIRNGLKLEIEYATGQQKGSIVIKNVRT